MKEQNFFLFIIFFWIKLSYYYLKYSFTLLQKLFVFFISLFYLLEYIFIFIFVNTSIYIWIVYKFTIKENFIKFKKGKIYYETNIKNYKRKNEKKNNIMSNKLLRAYNNKWMIPGFIKVYIQVFLRKLKDNKNYLFFIFNLKIKNKYFLLKKKIMNFSIYIYIYTNYNLVIFFENFKKRAFNVIVIISFIEIYKKVKIKIKFFFFLDYIYKFIVIIKHLKKWK